MFLRKITYVVLVIFTCILISSCEEKSSLTFVIDKTYSMKNDIKQVKDAANDIMNIMHKKNTSQIENVVLVTFDDPGFNLVVKTNDLLELQRHLYAIEVIGNKDCPEMSLSGTRLGLQESLPGSYIYVFTDDGPKDYQVVDEVKNLAQMKQNQVVFVITPNVHCNSGNKSFTEYYKIAAATNGQVFRLTKKSDVKSVITYIEETISGQRTPVISKLLPPNEWSDVDFIIDDKTEYGIVTTSGERVSLIVKKSPSDYEKLTWLRNVKIIKLKSCGDYTVRVKGSGTTSVMVFGRTDFTFKHGFSVFRPTSLNHTMVQPITGQKLYLSIKIIDKEGDVDAKTARILNMDENIIMEKTLEAVNTKMKLYVTAPFEPPASNFKIEIVGYSVKTNKTILRKSQTPVEPQNPSLEAPAIKYFNPTMLGKEGNITNLPCEVSGFPVPDVTWVRDGVLIIHDAFHYTIYKNKTLSINVTKEDSGNYTCKANNTIGSVKRSVRVYVYDMPAIKYFKPTILLKEGRITNLPCEVSGFPIPDVTWIKDGVKIIQDPFHYTIYRNKTLSIKVRKEDSGNYTCKANNTIGSVKRTVRVDIYDLPTIKYLEPTVLAKVGNITNLPCDVKEFTVPDVTWFKDGVVINHDAFHYTIYRNKTLSIKVTKDDSGNYTCKANNEFKSVERTVRVDVYVEVSIKLPKTTRLEIKLNGTRKLMCNANGFPKPDIQWKFYSKCEKNNVTGKIIGNGSILLLKNLRIEDDGFYSCNAKNLGSSKILTYDVNIKYGPQILMKKNTFEAIVGDHSLRIPCTCRGYPKPTFEWISKGFTIADDNKTYIQDDGTLFLLDIDSKDAGMYKCKAENKLNVDTAMVRVTVAEYPKVKSTLRKHINEGETTVIKCDVPHSRFDLVVWYKDKSKYYTTEDLNLNNVSAFDAGAYVCRVSNWNGAVTGKALNVIVNSKLKFISKISPIIKYEEGKQVYLDCTTRGSPKAKVQWIHNGIKLSSSRSYYRVKMDESSRGQYICYISNDLSTVKRVFNIN